jgi:hypothetical protein
VKDEDLKKLIKEFLEQCHPFPVVNIYHYLLADEKIQREPGLMDRVYKVCEEMRRNSVVPWAGSVGFRQEVDPTAHKVELFGQPETAVFPMSL